MKRVALKIQRHRYSKAAVYEVSVHHLLRRESGGCPDVVALHEAFVHDGHVCMAFERHGTSLDDALDRGALSPARARRVTRQILRALDCLHRCGYGHTDIKPDNILYDARTGEARLADLGSAENEFRQGSTFGTRDYMAPELIIGAPLSPAVDMWSLGCTVFEMLAARRLFNPRRAASKKYREFSRDDDAIEVPLGEEAKADLAAEEAEQLAPGTVVAGKYRLEKVLGQGHFGTVWSAVQINEAAVDGSYDTLWGFAQGVQRNNSPVGAGAIDPGKEWRKVRGADDLLDLALNYEHVLEITRLRGALPEEMIRGARYRSSYFEHDGALRFRPKIHRASLRSLLRRHAILSGDDLDCAADFLNSLLMSDPSARMPAKEALNHPWPASVRGIFRIRRSMPREIAGTAARSPAR